MANYKTKHCSICGKLFKPKCPSQQRCEDLHYKYCPVCGKQIPWKEYDYCCSVACTVLKRKQTCKKLYGVEHAAQNLTIQAKARATCLKNHGVEYPAQNAEIRNKQFQAYQSHYGKNTNYAGYQELESRKRAACLDKYGVEYSFQSDNNKLKSKQTSLERYGTEYPMQNELIKELHKQSVKSKYGVDNIMKTEVGKSNYRNNCIDKYGVDSPMKVPEIKDKIIATNLERYNVPWYVMTDECKQLARNVVSKRNLAVVNKLSELGYTDATVEFRVKDTSFDVCCPTLSTVFEIDPTYTHNIAQSPFTSNGNLRGPDYHLYKSKLAESIGYSCVHIFDWDDIDDVLDVYTIPKYNIQVNKCTIKLISINDIHLFNNIHVINSAKLDAEYLLGLFYDANCVSIIGFDKVNESTWTLCTILHDYTFNISDSISCLFEYFCNQLDPSTVTTTIDLSKPNRNIIASLNFKLSKLIAPQKLWSKSNYMVSDDAVKQSLDVINTYMIEDSSDEWLLANNWLPVYNCGYAIYEWRRQ